MYALKTIGKNTEGKIVESVKAMGEWYNLELEEPSVVEENPHNVVARVSSERGDVIIVSSQDAYITTLDGTTVRVIRNRGKY